MNLFEQNNQQIARRTFLGGMACGIGQAALGTLLAGQLPRAAQAAAASHGGSPGLPHFPPKAKRVLCLFQSGGMSHVDLFDSKPTLTKHHGQEIPPSVKGTQRLTGMTSGQAAYPVVAPLKGGRPCGQQRTWPRPVAAYTAV